MDPGASHLKVLSKGSSGPSAPSNAISSLDYQNLEALCSEFSCSDKASKTSPDNNNIVGIVDIIAAGNNGLGFQATLRVGLPPEITFLCSRHSSYTKTMVGGAMLRK